MIYFKKRQEYFQSIVSISTEHIENFDNKHIKQIIQNAVTNPIFTKNLANGDWTTLNTIIDNNKHVQNIMKINIDKDMNGTIENQLDQSNKEIYNIQTVGNMHIIGILSNDKNKTINIHFMRLNSKKNNLRDEEVPKCIVTIKNENNILHNYHSYKIYDTKIIGGKLSRIILSKHFYDYDIKEKYDLNTYNKYVHYKYPEEKNIIKIDYSHSNPSKYNNLIDKLKNNYNNILFICYQRDFYTVDNEFVRTPLSHPYSILAINKDNKLFNKIIIEGLHKEKELNHIKKSFLPKEINIYIYKFTKKDMKYETTKEIVKTKNIFGLKNNADKMFNSNQILIPDLSSNLLINSSQYTLVLCKTKKIDNERENVVITPDDLMNIL